MTDALAHCIDEETEAQRGSGSGWDLAEAGLEPRSLSPIPGPSWRTPPMPTLPPSAAAWGPPRPMLPPASLHVPARPSSWCSNAHLLPGLEWVALGLPSRPGGSGAATGGHLAGPIRWCGLEVQQEGSPSPSEPPVRLAVRRAATLGPQPLWLVLGMGGRGHGPAEAAADGACE